MNDKDREVLAEVSRFNRNMGSVVLALLSGQVDGRLPAETLHDLAAQCDEMSALLDNHAAKIERSLHVIEGDVTDVDLDDGLEDRAAAHGSATAHRVAARDCWRRALDGGASVSMLEATHNLLVVAGACAVQCGCRECIPRPAPSTGCGDVESAHGLGPAPSVKTL